MKRTTGTLHTACLLVLVGLLAGSLACTARRPAGPTMRDADAEAVEADVTQVGDAQQSEQETVATDDAATAPSEPRPEDEFPTPAVDAGRSDADKDANQAQRGPGSAIKDHAEAGVEGMIIGTVIGGQIGSTYGAAVGAALFGLYGFITGDVPFESGRGSRSTGRRGGRDDADAAMEREIEDELERQEALENEIEEELKRQEELLAAISKEEEITSVQEDVDECTTATSTDPLAAPAAPCERNIPDSIFDKKVRKDGRKERVVKTLDADRDGRPEIEIVVDADTGKLVSRAEDTDYDGVLDAHNSYDEKGRVNARQEDTNGDGVPDRWISYETGQGSRTEVDRNFDGKRDGFYVYSNGTLEYEEHDTNNDGKIDRRVEYRGKLRVVELGDSNHDGQMDSTTRFDERGIPRSNERDTNGDGKPDLWEFYEGDDPGKLVLARKEEDVNHDGDVDVTSHYKKGKLVRKEVANPDLIQ